MVTDSDTVTFKFNDGRDQDNIWGSGIYTYVLYSIMIARWLL